MYIFEIVNNTIKSFSLAFRFFLGNLFLQILIPDEMKRGLTESYKNMTVEELSTDITDVCWYPLITNLDIEKNKK